MVKCPAWIQSPENNVCMGNVENGLRHGHQAQSNYYILVDQVLYECEHLTKCKNGVKYRLRRGKWFIPGMDQDVGDERRRWRFNDRSVDSWIGLLG